MEIQERGVFDASNRGGTPSQPVIGSSVSFLSMWAPQEQRQKDVSDLCVCVCVCVCSQGLQFESRRGTNVLWQDIDLHLPHSTNVM